MLSPRWRKVLSDLWSNKARTLLVALSVAVGVFAIGTVATTYVVMNEDFPSAYHAISPHSAIIVSMPFDDDLLETVHNTPGVAAVEGRTYAGGQVKLVNGNMASIQVAGIPPIDMMQINKVRVVQGDGQMDLKDIYVERSAFTALGLKVGDPLVVELPDGRKKEARLAGAVHDINGNPFGMTGMVGAYASPETIEWLGGTRFFNRMLVRVSERESDEAHVKSVAKLVADKISRSGRQVYLTQVFRPGQHPAQSTLDAVMALMGGLGVLALFLSAFMVINTINALLNQQVRQIGMMKAIGATFGQVTGMYLVLILSFGLVALAFSIPLAGLVGYAGASGIGLLVNSDLNGFRIPQPALILMIVVGLGVPLFAGLGPVIGGARKTVREAMSSYGLSNTGSRSAFDRLLETMQGLPRPLLLSVRNTFRRKGRLLLTLITLVLGGGIFMGVFNVRESLNAEIEQTFNYVLADLNVAFGRSYRMQRINEAIGNIEGIEVVEGWGEMVVQAMKPDNQNGDDIVLVAPPAGSKMIDPVMTGGRWLLPEDENAVVIGNHFVKMRPDVQIGDTIMIRINEKKHPFKVVGVYRMAGTTVQPIVYANFEYISRLLNAPDQVYSLRIVTDRHDRARQDELRKALLQRFEAQGFAVGNMQTSAEIVEQQGMIIDVLVYLLLFMAMLIAVVGGLGLMGTMSMNVLERTREIGVMRSIGAVNSAIMQLVVVEGMMIGLISWALGALLSLPITQGLNNLIGVSLLNVPMVYRFSGGGMILWLVVVLVLSALACILPARNAVRLTVRDVLAYE